MSRAEEPYAKELIKFMYSKEVSYTAGISLPLRALYNFECMSNIRPNIAATD